MIEEPPLLTVKRPSRRPTADQIAAFQNMPTSFVVDAMYGAGALSPVIRPLGEGRDLDCRAAGPALTVDNGPADILALHAALGLIAPGDIVVSSFQGHQGCAAAGDRISAMIKNCGAAGFVTDGPMRDYAGLLKVGLPSWCTGLNPGSPFCSGPGRVGFAVQIGGQQVETGDMIVADRDGVVVVPFDAIGEVIEMLHKVSELEAALDAELQRGLKVPADIRELMASDRVRYVD